MRVEKPSGGWPVNELIPTRNTFNFVRSEKEEGMGPRKVLLLKSRLLRRERAPKLSGIVPEIDR